MVALFPHAPVGRGIRRHPADLHRPGVEHGVQLLRVAEVHSARAAGSRAHLRLRRVAAVRGTGAAVWRDRPGVELHGVGGGRLVLPDGVRNVRARQARFPAAGAGLVPANRRQRRRHVRHLLGPGHHDRRDSADRSTGVAAGHRVVGQVQVRAGGEQRAAAFGGAESAAPVEPAGALPHGRDGAAGGADQPAGGAPPGDGRKRRSRRRIGRWSRAWW